MRLVLLVFIVPPSGLGGLLMELRRALKNECPQGHALQATGTYKKRKMSADYYCATQKLKSS